MSEPETTVTKASMYVLASAEMMADTVALQAQLAEMFDVMNDPNYVPPPPWEGPPITPEPEAYRRLLDATDNPLIRAVLELHGPEHGYIRHDGTCEWRCEGCEAGGYEWEYPDWPCETAVLIGLRLGVEGP